ncbi:MAG: aminotransferase class I/II-fold pyridoxal phosphate-dependent enzyme [Chitinophagales bacterium]|nr:aminotransferase class I/II-fold pyridoxal phosphate-dependent enzyme [Chitinophagales bacterium]
MRDELLAKEKISRLLEPPAADRDAVRKQVIDYIEHFINTIDTAKAYNVNYGNGDGLFSSPISDDPIAIEEALSLLSSHVDIPGLNPASGGHLGYIPGGGIYYAALGDFLADIFNRYAGIYFAGPGAVRMENLLIQWIAGIMKYPSQAIGNLTSGGSIANLIGIVCARDASQIKSCDFDKAVIYLTKQVHHSVDKAIRIAGLKECIVRRIPMDAGYRMKADDLRRAIEHDKSKGLIPFLVIASAGTTDVGAVDPLEEIGAIAQKQNIWYHIDAAYGGFFMLTEEGEKKLKGIESSDTLVVDPHKGLFLPYGSGVLLAKDGKQLKASHSYQANYMQDASQTTEEISPADVSPELTKHFRGLRLWLPLKLMGVKPFSACLEEKLLLTKYFYHEIQRIGFEVGEKPDLSVVTYRYIPKHGDANEFNKRLCEEVQRDGRIFISSTLLDGKFTLRAAILSFRTHLQTVDLLLNVMAEKVKMLERA